jgi:hypothetical protein
MSTGVGGGFDFHKDSISAIELNLDEELMFTGGRDGSIFFTKLGDSSETIPYMKVYETEPSK